METFAYALVTVIAWGTWLAPSQGIVYASERVRSFYVAAANLLVAIVVALLAGVDELNWTVSVFSGLGGLVWSASSFFAFYASDRIGIARAMGIWSPLNVAFSFIWGIFLFGELRDATLGRWAVIAASVMVALVGLSLILFSNTSDGGRDRVRSSRSAFGAAGVAGLLWGSYFVPLQLAQVDIWSAVLPMSVGIFLGSFAGVVLGKDRILLSKPNEYARYCLSGVLWGIGNYGSLKLMEAIGTGKGFTIAQLCVVVNALVGIYWFHQPKRGTSAAKRMLIGVILATFGGIALGGSRFF